MFKHTIIYCIWLRWEKAARCSVSIIYTTKGIRHPTLCTVYSKSKHLYVQFVYVQIQLVGELAVRSKQAGTTTYCLTRWYKHALLSIWHVHIQSHNALTFIVSMLLVFVSCCLNWSHRLCLHCMEAPKLILPKRMPCGCHVVYLLCVVFILLPPIRNYATLPWQHTIWYQTAQ